MNFESPLVPQPNDEHLATAKVVYDSLKRYKKSDLWFAKEKVTIFGRDFEVSVQGYEERPPVGYVKRLAGTLSVVEGLKEMMEPLMQEFYEYQQDVGGEMVPAVSAPAELWELFEINGLDLNSMHESIPEILGNTHAENNDGALFCLSGGLPWNANDGIVISVSAKKIEVGTTASLFL